MSKIYLKNIIQELHFGTGPIGIHQLARFLCWIEIYQKSTFLENPSWVGTKNGHFSTRPGGGGVPVIFEPPGSPKIGIFGPPRPNAALRLCKVSCIIEIVCFF